ncbi:hypothetical protein SAMD00019534_035620 [Acytostelium subglobosum LB1]|uniref:hypothetical protein n=1 Tax=Acytostelium subglobosum LB1 TaxID=1410327 RepID=UPI000644A1A6|nr:hypothetical protein SAMD00019534_035620 [Acytostelium subglobosum LB1]GAM20387.1 hypothetical protein SAMD00019534_035620 [Acytostelium subglobosum LB1]|eukprot:XP_012759908.1 hypothetical protein SAMD00019534_035620 [Acytostelium subglobosum LB1]
MQSSGNQQVSASTSSPNLMANTGNIASSASTSFTSYNKLPAIDFEQMFSAILKESTDTLKYCHLVQFINTGGKKIGKSWQPFNKKHSNPAYLVLGAKSVMIVDATTVPPTLQRRLPYCDLKEMLVDSSDVGLFSLQLTKEQMDNNHKHPQPLPSIVYFCVGAERRELIDSVVATFEEATKEYFALEHKGLFVIRRTNMLAGEAKEQKEELKCATLKVLDEMSLMGFTAQDLWDGDADLKHWVAKVRPMIKLNSDERFVVEFVLPDSAYDTAGVCKKVFRVPNNISAREITNFLCAKIHVQDPTNFTIVTMKGREILPEDFLVDYGLGSMFDNWQLCLVERGKMKRAGMYELEVHYPDVPQYAGRFMRSILVDGYQPAEVVVRALCKDMEIIKPHLFSMSVEAPGATSSFIVPDNEQLSKHGLGAKFRKCKIKLVPKKFPKASSNRQQNIDVTLSIFNDVIEAAHQQALERKELRKQVLCQQLVDMMVDIAYEECVRASTLTMRMASLSAISKTAMYKFLALKEQEDLKFFSMLGHKHVVDDAKDLIYNLTNLNGPSAFIDVDQEEQPSLQMRVPPPPPPPILGFDNFKKRLETSATPTSATKEAISQQQRATRVGGGNLNVANAVDMNQILGMRGKLRATVQLKKEDDGKFDETQELVLRPVTQREKPIQVTNSKETNELMQRLQKRNAIVQSALADAEDLGDF